MPRQLNVTFRGGRLMAAYLYLNRDPTPAVAHTKPAADGMLVDYNDTGVPLGIEFVAPSRITLAAVNDLLSSLGQELSTVEELWPLLKHTPHAAA